MRHLLERFPGDDSALIVPGGAALFGLQPDCRLLCDVRKSEKLLYRDKAGVPALLALTAATAK
jgi:hypothetical protein